MCSNYKDSWLECFKQLTNVQTLFTNTQLKIRCCKLKEQMLRSLAVYVEHPVKQSRTSQRRKQSPMRTWQAGHRLWLTLQPPKEGKPKQLFNSSLKNNWNYLYTYIIHWQVLKLFVTIPKPSNLYDGNKNVSQSGIHFGRVFVLNTIWTYSVYIYFMSLMHTNS